MCMEMNTTTMTKTTLRQIKEGDIIKMSARAPQRRVTMIGHQGIHTVLMTTDLDGQRGSVSHYSPTKRVLKVS